MAKIETAGLGTVDIDENQIIEFRQGLPGFPSFNRFALIAVEELPFSYLQSLDDPSIAFVVADPFTFFPHYSFDLSQADLEKLESKSPESISVFGIITLSDNVGLSTMNLVAPVVINAEKKMGMQTILSVSSYTTKHRIFQTSNE